MPNDIDVWCPNRADPAFLMEHFRDRLHAAGGRALKVDPCVYQKSGMLYNQGELVKRPDSSSLFDMDSTGGAAIIFPYADLAQRVGKGNRGDVRCCVVKCCDLIWSPVDFTLSDTEHLRDHLISLGASEAAADEVLAADGFNANATAGGGGGAAPRSEKISFIGCMPYEQGDNTKALEERASRLTEEDVLARFDIDVCSVGMTVEEDGSRR